MGNIEYITEDGDLVELEDSGVLNTLTDVAKGILQAFYIGGCIPALFILSMSTYNKEIMAATLVISYLLVIYHTTNLTMDRQFKVLLRIWIGNLFTLTTILIVAVITGTYLLKVSASPTEFIKDVYLKTGTGVWFLILLVMVSKVLLEGLLFLFNRGLVRVVDRKSKIFRVYFINHSQEEPMLITPTSNEEDTENEWEEYDDYEEYDTDTYEIEDEEEYNFYEDEEEYEEDNKISINLGMSFKRAIRR